MNQAELVESWKREEQQPFTGWDFSYLDGRMLEDQAPWSYSTRAAELMRQAASVIDLGTGGGERLLKLRKHWPKKVVVTEDYPPNVKLATERLTPLGVKVVEVELADNVPMPFADGEFDLVLNRHSGFNSRQVARILNVGGTFLTQQVHGLWACDLLAAFDAKPQWPTSTLDKYVPQLKAAGLAIVNAQEWSGRLAFSDVGAIVYYLKAVPWLVPGFSVETHVRYLFKLQSRLENGEALAFCREKISDRGVQGRRAGCQARWDEMSARAYNTMDDGLKRASMATDPILLPNAPSIERLSFRPIRGEQDADALYAVQTGRMAHDKVDPFCTSEDLPTRNGLRAELAKAVAASQQDRWLVAQLIECVIGYSQIKTWPEGDGTWVYLTLGWVLPEWRGQGIGTAMLHWTEDRIRRLAAANGACASPNEKCEFAANASSTEKEATALLLHEGYRAGYTVLELGFDISMPVPVHPLPPGIEVRPVSPDHYALIAASVREAYQNEYEGGRFNEEYDSDIPAYVAQLSEPKHDPTLWQVAWDGDQVAGQVLSVVENGRAAVFEVSVRPAWRRRGLARGLLSRALHTLRERGLDVIRLHTVAEFRTRARDLYGSVGFHVLKEFPRYRKSFSCPW